MSSQSNEHGVTAAGYAVLPGQEEHREPQRTNLSPTSQNSDPFRHFDSNSTTGQRAHPPIDNGASEEDLGDEDYTTMLHRSPYILCLVLLYATLTVFEWSITCILVSHPITTSHYGIYMDERNSGGYPLATGGTHNLYVENEHWYRAARVIQAVVSTLTIPLASAVCSAGAIVFAQQGKREKDLSLRQLIVLANRGWADISTYWSLTPGVQKNGWKRYGSSFLLLAVLLNLLGGIISPVQQLFLSSKTIKTPTLSTQTFKLQDIAGIHQDVGTDDNFIVGVTRSALTTVNIDDPQSQLWPGSNLTAACNALDRLNGKLPNMDVCFDKGITFSNMSQLSYPFFAELPNGFNTGLIRQFLPRINSTATYQAVDSSEFPKNCETKKGSFNANMGNSSDIAPYLWHIKACMPADMRNSPWKATGDRQDFTEELWLNFTFWDEQAPRPGGDLFPSKFFKVTVKTSAGYFELPNYMNNQFPGPLLDKDPTKNLSRGACGIDCEPQFYNVNKRSISSRQTNNDETWNSTQLERVRNKGPLLTTALALFGQASYPTYPSTLKPHVSEDEIDSNDITSPCAELTPFGRFVEYGWPSTARCMSSVDGSGADTAVAGWVLGFVQQDEVTLSNAFTVAAFLANGAWLQNAGSGDSMFVNYDLGDDSEVPTISTVGIIVISILKGVFLLSLLAIALYAAATPSWTDSLDAWAMIRIGGALGREQVPLLVAKSTDTIRTLDETPGWIGDLDESQETGRIALGALGRVRGKRRYICYGAQDKDNSDGIRASGIELESMTRRN